MNLEQIFRQDIHVQKVSLHDFLIRMVTKWGGPWSPTACRWWEDLPTHRSRRPVASKSERVAWGYPFWRKVQQGLAEGCLKLCQILACSQVLRFPCCWDSSITDACLAQSRWGPCPWKARLWDEACTPCRSWHFQHELHDPIKLRGAFRGRQELF